MTVSDNSCMSSLKLVAPVSGIVNVLLEHEYELIDSTPTCWVFESKNPAGYAFVLPATKKHVPVEMVRHVLRSEPLDVDAVVKQSVEKSDEEAAKRYYDGEEPVVIDEEEGLRILRETPHVPANRTPEEIEQEMEFIRKVREESSKIADEDRIDISGNLKYYLYGD